MTSSENGDKTRKPVFRPPLRATRLLGQLRERLRYLHYSLRTEEAYLHWARFFIHFHGLRHPREMGKREIEAFLTMLATERKVSVSTHRQALSALLFLYKEVLGRTCPGSTRSGGRSPSAVCLRCSRWRRCSGLRSWTAKRACSHACFTAPACAWPRRCRCA